MSIKDKQHAIDTYLKKLNTEYASILEDDEDYVTRSDVENAIYFLNKISPILIKDNIMLPRMCIGDYDIIFNWDDYILGIFSVFSMSDKDILRYNFYSSNFLDTIVGDQFNINDDQGLQEFISLLKVNFRDDLV